jgi:hypothetical protein
MGFTESALTDDHDGPTLSLVYGFDGFENVVRRVRNIEKLRRRNLDGAGTALIRQFDDSAFQPRGAEFFA